MERFAQVLDDIDDMTGLALGAVTPGAIFAFGCAAGLGAVATVHLGLLGIPLALVACGVSMALSSALAADRRRRSRLERWHAKDGSADPALSGDR